MRAHFIDLRLDAIDWLRCSLGGEFVRNRLVDVLQAGGERKERGGGRKEGRERGVCVFVESVPRVVFVLHSVR